MTITEKPTIDDQIKFIKDFVADPPMRDAIIENLIAIRYQQQIAQAGQVDSNALVTPLTGTIACTHRFDPLAIATTAGKFCLDCGQLVFRHEGHY